MARSALDFDLPDLDLDFDLPTIDGDDGWEQVTPLLRRRKKAAGGFEFQATPSFQPPTSGPSEPKRSLATDLQIPMGPLGSHVTPAVLGEAVRGIPARIKEGWAGMTELAAEGFAAGFVPPEAGQVTADTIWGDEGTLPREIRDSVRRGRETTVERLGELGAAGGMSPVATALVDSTADVGAAVLDPVNYLPGPAALRSRRPGVAPVAREVAEEAIEEAPRLRRVGRLGESDDLFAPGELEALEPPPVERRAQPREPGPPILSPEERALGENIDQILARRRAVEAPEVSVETPAPPPPRVPIADLPDPAAVPLRDFQAISDLDPPTSAAVHREGVAQAVAADEPVPSSVLEDYTDLSADVAPEGVLIPPPDSPVAARPGEAGFVKIPTGPSFLRRWFTRDGRFQAMGDLRGYTFDRTFGPEGAKPEAAAAGFAVRRNVRDFSSVVADEVARDAHDPQELLAYLSEGATGGNDLSGVSPRLRAVTLAMREHLDEQTGQLLATYGPDDMASAMRQTLEANKGTYWPRVHRTFQDPDYAGLVDPLSRSHDPKEQWRWDSYMTWAQAERQASADAPLYGGAQVRLPDGTVGRVGSYDPKAKSASVTLADGTKADVPRDQLHNLADHLGSDWTDDELAGYGQRLLHRDADAFLGFSRPVVGREGRHSLNRRIIQDPTVDRLPTDLGQKVRDGKMSLPGAIEAAKQRPGWWAEYVTEAPGLPKEIDDLLGLERDPSVGYQVGAMRTAHDLATYKLHRDLLARGQDSLFFDRPTAGFHEQIGGKGPLAGKYTSPEAAAIVRGTDMVSKEAGKLLNAWRKVNGAVKLGKTSLNFPGGQMRNLVAWVPQLMAGGHFTAAFNPARAVQLSRLHLVDKMGTQRGALAKAARYMADRIELPSGARLGEVWDMSVEALEPEIEYLYRKGVLGESSHGTELRHYQGAFEAKRPWPSSPSPPGRLAKGYVNTMTNFWASGDDLGKHLVYRAELQNLLWADGKLKATEALPADYFARPELEALANEAAGRTRLTTPTSSMTLPMAKALADAPIAPFPGWTAEVFRNAKEQIRLGVTDLRSPNPRMKVLGAKRLAGFASTATLAAAATGNLVSRLNQKAQGKPEFDPDAARSFVYPWSRQSSLVIHDVDHETGDMRFSDVSSLMPYAAFADPMSTILRSAADPQDDSWDAAVDSVQELTQPFIDEDILPSALLTFAANKQFDMVQEGANIVRRHEIRQPGYQVHTSGASGETQVKQSLYHFWRNLGPSGIIGLQGERALRAFFKDNAEVRDYFAQLSQYDRTLDIKDEAWGSIGLRTSTVNIPKAIGRAGADYVAARWDASRTFGRQSHMGVGQQARPETVIELKAEANRAGRQTHEQTVTILANAMKLGFTEQKLRDTMTERKVSKKHIEALLEDAKNFLAGAPLAHYIPVVE